MYLIVYATPDYPPTIYYGGETIEEALAVYRKEYAIRPANGWCLMKRSEFGKYLCSCYEILLALREPIDYAQKQITS